MGLVSNCELVAHFLLAPVRWLTTRSVTCLFRSLEPTCIESMCDSKEPVMRRQCRHFTWKEGIRGRGSGLTLRGKNLNRTVHTVCRRNLPNA
ncbi:hypothetical protein KQX54_015315 [Cotesia glomerata]|uniref:Secreted protein n=1 Tax=Cotesia glomerata TaxID=32391 RepID=A0AAV7IT63_COTGL|nr:hypothetical protein KQX54_015315 [Cotesia glomerata]